MRHWILPLAAALATLFSAGAAPPVRACTYPPANLVPVGLVQSTPDPDNPPVVPSGGEILVLEPCWIGGCTATSSNSTIRVTASGGAERPAEVELLSKILDPAGWRVWRVHPQPALQPGRYTLHTQYRSPADAAALTESSYPFTVSGTVSDTSSMKFELSAYPLLDPNGPGFACQTIQTSCGPQTPPPATTRRKHRVSIAFKETPRVPASEVGQFMFRLVSTDTGTDPDSAPYWVPGAVYASSGALAVEYPDVRAEYCVELQALRVRDLALQSLGKHCVRYTLPTELDPAPFDTCQADPAEYARAYCADNAFACSEQNPRAGEESVKSVCKYYALVCAPFIGNRAARDRVGCGMP